MKTLNADEMRKVEGGVIWEIAIPGGLILGYALSKVLKKFF
jgi:bacteriocin-like protein